MEFSLHLLENPAVNNSDASLQDLTAYFSNWRHSNRSLGGNWQGEGALDSNAPGGPGPAWLEAFFMTGLGRRIAVRSGGITWWRGQIVRLEYQHKGQTFVRTMEELANRLKVLYTRIGPNLLTNGDVESAAWATWGTPSTIETTNTWYAAGSQAMHIIADGANEGAWIASAVTISASRPYISSVITNVASGVWSLRVLDETTATVVAQRPTAGCGRSWLQCTVPESNSYTSVNVRLDNGAAGVTGEEVYADAAYLRTAPVRSETKWYVNADSASVYGRIEGIYLEGEMSDAEADQFATKELAQKAWMRSEAADRGATFGAERLTPDRLTVTLMGEMWTLGWRHARTDGTAQAGTHMAALLDESQFYQSASAILDTNTSEVYLESGNPRTLWRELEKIARGGSGGSPWMAGAYPGWLFRFEARPTGTQYQFQDGRMRYYGGGAIPALEFAPGWCWMADMPEEPLPAGGTADDDPRRVWLDETWFVYENGQVRLEWAREREG